MIRRTGLRPVGHSAANRIPNEVGHCDEDGNQQREVGISRQLKNGAPEYQETIAS